MGKKNFTQEDLDRMGLKDNGNGTFSKAKTRLQPRDIVTNKLPNGMTAHLIPLPEFNEKKKKKADAPTYWKGMNIQDVFAHAEANNYIFIPGNVPSSKNSKQLFKNSRTGNNFISSSELCKKYVERTKGNYMMFKSRFLKMTEGKKKPYRILFRFIRNSKHKSDFHNLVQLPMDLMIEHEWIDDDNMDEVVPVPSNEPYFIDKNIPGLIIKIL